MFIRGMSKVPTIKSIVNAGSSSEYGEKKGRNA